MEKALEFLERKFFFEEKKKELGKLLKNRFKKIQNSVQRFSEEIKLGQTWEFETHIAEMLQAYFFRLKIGMSEIQLEDWDQNEKLITISLDPLLSPQEQLKHHFQLSGKLKKKLAHALPSFDLANKELELISKKLEIFNQIDTIKRI